MINYTGMGGVKYVDTREYVSVLRDIVKQGREVCVVVSGSSMAPFLVHRRDVVYFKSPWRALKKGDIVFYQRDNGQFVLHRIVGVHDGVFDLLGDNQTEVEHGVRSDQIFGLVTGVKRKGKMISPGSFWWWFFAHVWTHMIPVRHVVMSVYAKVRHQ
ncbi:MAG: S24/S26 family peptidase [Lactimicrobium massiliense]|nr:S24/S26 family peptidase [Lactimicrobium massiliense]MDD6559551.1 S24/S26 family peptidase [Lactimicrobium massiliense]